MEELINDRELFSQLITLDNSIKILETTIKLERFSYGLYNREQTENEIIARTLLIANLGTFLETPEYERTPELYASVIKQVDKLKSILNGKLAIEIRVSNEELDLVTEYARFGLNSAINCRYLASGNELASEALLELVDEVSVSYLVQDFKNNLINPRFENYSLNLADQHISKENSPILFLSSNNKNLTEQVQEFQTHRLIMADDLQATIFCAALVRKAKDNDVNLRTDLESWTNDEDQKFALRFISQAEQDILERLIVGQIRTRFGALSIEDGFLRMLKRTEVAQENIWSFGTAYY